MKSSIFSEIPFSNVMLAFALLLSVPLSAPAPVLPQCVETNGVKYVQPPNLQGLDVWNSGPWMLADDFICTNSGPITDIHIWGSWLNDSVDVNSLTFSLGIYDNVPANANNPFSHPGTNLLWQQTFAPGQYSESPFATGTETFLDPGPPVTMGTDSQAWYYCFYPTNPFVQTGFSTAPKTYWLAVYAQLPSGVTSYQYGWKTTFIVQNDTSVHAPWPGSLPINNPGWIPTLQSPTGGPLDLAFMLTTPTNTPPPVVCVETNSVKFLLSPNTLGGLDVKDSRDNIVLADDFYCNTTGPITDIHLWGSWLNDQHGTITNFWIGIYNDVPAVTNIPAGQITPSHPGTNLLWQQSFVSGQYAESIYTNGNEYFYNPTNNQIMGGDQFAWYYCFYPTNPFVQQGTAANPTNYWLAVRAQISDNTNLFGWKSSITNYHDAAVWGTVANGLPIGNWQSMTNPLTQRQIDLSFKLTTPPVLCVESDFDKYVQGPNTLGGYDVWNTPYVLADDFVCTNSGPISDIHLWGSWLYDSALTNSITFWLGIYDDVPVGTGNPYSHPGTNLLWQQWFAPGKYAETIWTANAYEYFLDPGPTNIVGSDSVVWYYCFYPTNAFQQLGTPTNSKTYWLAAYAQLPVGGNYNYGWKTTTNVQHDISVHATWPGSAPTNNPGWTPTFIPTGGPLDLAFKLTMCGPVTIYRLAPTNVVVTWQGGGYLQSATNVTGPYIDVPGFPPSPYTDSSVTPTNKFYRLRCY